MPPCFIAISVALIRLLNKNKENLRFPHSGVNFPYGSCRTGKPVQTGFVYRHFCTNKENLLLWSVRV